MSESRVKNFWGKLLNTIGSNFHSYLRSQLTNIDLKRSQVHFLHYICKRGTIEQSELSNINHVNKSTTTRNIKNLLKYDYIVREKDTKDKRKFLLSPTEKGLKFHDELKEILGKWDEALAEGINDEEIEQFKKTANKIIANSDKLIERMKNNG